MAIKGFDEFSFAHDGIQHRLFRRGDGPGVVLLHELPGLNEACVAFGRELNAEFTVFMPLPCGEPGDDAPVLSFARLCVSREFRVFAAGGGSPIVGWLRGLCRKVHADIGGPGVGLIGLCLTGNFAIALMAEPSVAAPVTAEPSLPLSLPLIGGDSAALAVTPEELAAASARAAAGDAALLGFRFSNDKLCPAARFDALRRALGPAFEGHEIDSAPGNPHGLPPDAHSVLTGRFADAAGRPTREARARVVGFLREHMGALPPPAAH